jgi:hypothetical protein
MGKITRSWLPVLIAIFFGLVLTPSCSSDKSGGSSTSNKTSAPSKLSCDDGSSHGMGSECKATYEKILDCCKDETVATDSAKSLVCGMQVNEDACKQGGDIAANAQCALLSMRPECAESEDDASASGTDSGASNKECNVPCDSSEHMQSFVYDKWTCCTCKYVDIPGTGQTELKWAEDDCSESGEFGKLCANSKGEVLGCQLDDTGNAGCKCSAF